jgi:hypothetical protein
MAAQNRLVSMAADGDPGEDQEPAHITTQYKNPVFYVPGKTGIIDACINGRGQYSGETLEQIQMRYPGALLGELDTVAREAEESFKSAPVEITEERYWEMLEVLPPVSWVHGSSETESFKISERLYGDITAIFCRIGNRYFELSDSIRLPHAEIVKRCSALISS